MDTYTYVDVNGRVLYRIHATTDQGRRSYRREACTHPHHHMYAEDKNMSCPSCGATRNLKLVPSIGTPLEPREIAHISRLALVDAAREFARTIIEFVHFNFIRKH